MTSSIPKALRELLDQFLLVSPSGIVPCNNNDGGLHTQNAAPILDSPHISERDGDASTDPPWSKFSFNNNQPENDWLLLAAGHVS